jgi:hypothetical protein
MKTIDVNIANSVVDSHVQTISQVGSLTGKKFFKVEVRYAWQGGKDGFEKDKMAISSGSSKDFIPNRSPRRLCVKDFLIAGVIITKNVDNEDCLAINPKENGTCDLLLPINDNMLSALERSDAEAVKEAINGEKDHFFLKADVLVKIVNDAMKAEVARLEKLISSCQKMVQTLKSDIIDNERKAKDAEERWIKSAVSPAVEISGGGVVMTRVKSEE